MKICLWFDEKNCQMVSRSKNKKKREIELRDFSSICQLTLMMIKLLMSSCSKVSILSRLTLAYIVKNMKNVMK